MISVIASAIGPELLAREQQASGSYLPAFTTMAVSVAMLAAFAFFTPLPPLPTLAEDSDSAEPAPIAIPTAEEA